MANKKKYLSYNLQNIRERGGYRYQIGGFPSFLSKKPRPVLLPLPSLPLLRLPLLLQDSPLPRRALARIHLGLLALARLLRFQEALLPVGDRPRGILPLPAGLHVGLEADEHRVALADADAAHVGALVLEGMHKGAEVARGRAVVARQRGEAREPAVAHLDEPGGRDARAVQERRVLEGAAGFDAHVQPERRVRHEDPGVAPHRFAQQFVEDGGR
ncbi:hypothetical protein F4810DRAFT_86359 [Camillea tinctor]|nr:hypothetical protein F4810DRAFT_86359 [Camillea tinctor]